MKEKWEMMKLAVREVAMIRGSKIKNSTDRKIEALERALQNNIEARDSDRKLGLFKEYTEHITAIQLELEGLRFKRTQGAVLRSRVNWAEYGEKSSAFFLNLEKYNFNKKTITTICDPINGDLVTEENKILDVLNNYYAKLFQYKAVHLDLDYLGTLEIPQILEGDQYMLDGPIQLEEIHVALKQLKHGKCPGIDGLTPEFYLKFWPYLAKAFHVLFTEIVRDKILHSTARDGITSLLDKPEKDLLLVPNWRPLTY